METNNLTGEQTEVEATQSVATENIEVKGDTPTELSYGKFKDLSSLLKAYGNLEAEFTRRSQRLKELEGEVDRMKKEQTEKESFEKDGFVAVDGDVKNGDESKSTDKERYFADGNKSDDDGEKPDKNESAQEIIRNYLLEVLKSRSSESAMGGAVLTAPPHKPKTLEEASALAREYIKIKGEK
ncbi:MAG: hypothetical protein MJ072_02915 [Clostridia bacterium]|nr:hypothetical protein [Clostridia bacterium]